ncbi:hypothetical protein MNB_SUP05-SYMBIONT-4-687 [hydrothermal vent metagenome]|uniref:Uncharacterized protein n=1 Tax=hydrothermal vent metagenome TaxID=652676 RepID=A0A1W1DZ39_9ZZZZ
MASSNCPVVFRLGMLECQLMKKPFVSVMKYFVANGMVVLFSL